MARRTGAGRARAATVALALALACAAALVGLATGCADPVTAYHRQFDYQRRVGGKALTDGRYDDAREHFAKAVVLADYAAATDLERIEALTRLVSALRLLGRFDEAAPYAQKASQLVGRQRLAGGGLVSSLPRVGGAWMLERARLETATGDLVSAEATIREFFEIRGDSGGDPREAAEAYWLLGELCRVRGHTDEARTAFRRAAESVNALDEDRDAGLRGSILYRAAETELALKQVDGARAWIDRARPNGAAAPAARTGLLLTLGLVDVSEGNRDQSEARLSEAMERMSGDDDPGAGDVAAPERAIRVAAGVHGSDGEKLLPVVERVLAIARRGPPLQAIEAGGAAFDVGSRLFDAGAGGRAPGLELMEQARQTVVAALGQHPHDLRTEIDFGLARDLAGIGRLDDATARCVDLLQATAQVADAMRVTQTERLMACGQIEARNHQPARARETYGKAVVLAEEGGLPPAVRLELLLRLAGLAHQEGRDAEEQKLFERALVFVVPGIYERLSQLLDDAYGEQGPFQPSSAAARLAHVAARMPAHALVASPLQNVAERLSADDDAPPASR